MKRTMVISGNKLTAALLLCMAAFAVSCSQEGPGSSQEKEPSRNQRATNSGVNHDPAAAWKQLIAANFAGDEACAECHRKEYEAHQRSGHSRTAVRMAESELAQRLEKMGQYDDSRRDQKWKFSSKDGEFLVKDETHPTMPALPVTWLLGSGVHAQTAIAVDEKRGQGVELRWTWLANQQALGLTPDHAQFDEYNRNSMECFGRPLQHRGVLECLGCHMTMGPPPGAPPRADLFIPNVGCERCHGPRKKHAELAKIGRGHESKPLINYKNAEQYITACAQCHRDENSIDKSAEPHELARFQPYGLKKSKCYLNSEGQLSCAYCHDPHDATSHDRSLYIQQCQSCHQDQKQSTICPVKPQGDCIECHMPAVEWMEGIKFHDHWIRSH